MRDRLVLPFIWLVLLCPAAALAQTTGNIEGRIGDSSGAPLSGATVETTSPSLQGKRETQTAANGSFWLPGLPPGNYAVTVALSGFRSVFNTVTLSLDATAKLDLTLERAVAEEVNVSAEASLVDMTSTTTGTNYKDKVIARLPLGRNYADIVLRNPGVDTDRAKTLGRSLALTVYGSTSVENLYLIDGINTTNVIYGIQGKTINNEFVQEVEVKTGGYSAEYGGAMGGIVNVITHSGGNEFHGNAFVYSDPAGSRAAMLVDDSNHPSTMGTTPGPRWDAGASLGGFVVRDRLWFFGAYERVDAPGTTSRQFSNALVPSTQQFPITQTDSLYSGKLTWTPGRSTSIVATAFSDPSRLSGAILVAPGAGGLSIPSITSPDPGTWEASREIGGLDYALRASQVLGSSVFASLQASRHRDRFELEPTGAGGSRARFIDMTCEGGTPEAPCPLPDEPNFVSGGFGYIDGPTQKNTSRRTQVRGDTSLFLRDHDIKVGGEYQYDRSDAIFLFTGGQQVTRFNQFGQTYYKHEFLARGFDDLTPVSQAAARPKVLRYAAYLQDSWRPSPHWTVNLGLRWSENDVRDDLDRTVLKTTAEWQPRLGVVWAPGDNGKTKLFASAGRFSYGLPLDFAARVYGIQWYATTYNFDPVDTRQSKDVLNRSEAFVSGNSTAEPVDSGLKGIYQDELTVGIERLLTPELSVALKGTYRRLGRTIEDRCDLDYTRPETGGNSCAIANPGSGGRFARGDVPTCLQLDPPFDQCFDQGAPMQPARRLYRGVELLLRYQDRDRLWLQASYVYSSLRGNYDGLASGFGQTDPGILGDFDLPRYTRNNYGPLSLDRPHQARVDATYSLPVGLFAGLGAYVKSGRPLDRLGAVNENFFFMPVYLVPRGSAGRLPTLWEADLTLGWPFSIGPLRVTPQLYVYNVFNNQKPTYSSPFYRLFDPPGYPGTIYDVVVPDDYVNPNYGRVLTRQDPRLLRAALRISF